MSPTVNLEDVPHKLTFIWKKEENVITVIGLKKRKAALNPQASAIWELIDEKRTVKEIVDIYSQTLHPGVELPGFDYRDKAQTDVLGLLQELLDEGLITFEEFLWRRG